MIDMIIFGHVPGLRGGNQPLEEAGRRGTVLVNIGIPDPKSPVALKVRIRCEAEKASLVVRLGVGIAQARKTRNSAAKSPHFGTKVQKDLGGAVCRQVFAVKLSRLSANEERFTYHVNVC